MNKKDKLPLIARKWPLNTGNPKIGALIRRRNQLVKNLDIYQKYLDMLLSFIPSKKRRTVAILEVACGVGFSLLELSRYGFSTIGLDIDPHLCQLTNEAAEYFGIKSRSICGDACNLPIDDGCFDVVFSKNFFEHAYDVDLAIREQIRVLRPNGILIIHDGNMLNPVSLISLLILRPIKTHGRVGGIKWIITKSKVQKNLYGYLPKGRDEDIKTSFWWKKFLANYSSLEILVASTTGHFTRCGWPKIFHPFLGGCFIVARRKDDC